MLAVNTITFRVLKGCYSKPFEPPFGTFGSEHQNIIIAATPLQKSSFPRSRNLRFLAPETTFKGLYL